MERTYIYNAAKDRGYRPRRSKFSSHGSRGGSTSQGPRSEGRGPSRGGFGGGYRGGNRRRFGAAHQGRRRGDRIDISRFVKKAASPTAPKAHPIKHVFADFNFTKQLQHNLAAKNFVTPTPIQDQSIKHILEGKDLIGLANTGTGKTGAFLLPILQKLHDDSKSTALIIAPTRELAEQIDEEFKQFAAGMKLYSALCVGGAPIFRQINTLKRDPHVIIGTPGRIQDLIDRRVLRLGGVNFIVLDEVDRMLDMGFIDAVRAILSGVPLKRQSLFFSATMPPRIRALVSEFMNDPVTVEVQSGVTTDSVEQDVIRAEKHPAGKLAALAELLARPDLVKTLIFSETKRDVERLTEELIKKGFKVDSIHGDKRQRQRQQALTKFKENKVNILVATDVAARGLDIKDVSHVINYTIPQTYDDYVHRIGRTGRGNAKGVAWTFV